MTTRTKYSSDFTTVQQDFKKELIIFHGNRNKTLLSLIRQMSKCGGNATVSASYP